MIIAMERCYENDGMNCLRKLRLVKVNKYGEIEDDKEYGEEGAETVCVQINKTQDEGYIIGGWKFTYNDGANPYLLKLDSIGNVEWERIYPTEIIGAALYVYPTYDGGYIFSGYRGKGNPFAPYQNCYVTRVDSVGNVVWDKVYQEDTESILNSGGGITPVPNTTHYLLTYDYGKDEKRHQFVGEINDDGEIIWSKDYQYPQFTTPYFTEVYFDSEGGFISVAHQANENNPNRTEPFIMRFNSEGDTLWTKRIAIEPSENQYIRGFLATSDGGYLLTGLSYEGPYAWEIKIDSLGNTCWQTGCDSTYVEVVGLEELSGLAEAATVLVSPNPAQDELRVNIEGKTLNYWEIYNLEGRKLSSYTAAVTDISHLVSGVYIVKVYDTEGKEYIGKILIMN
ncbi:MAG: T9SS type A sorting domain-containing protein [Chitinophagales bacterium]|nr:T9SS type A sorting domain-containing protein [Chitinophagales bacterium]